MNYLSCMKLTKYVAVTCFLTAALSVSGADAVTNSNQNTGSQAFIAPLASKSLLLDIGKAASKIVVVGERGHILLSENGQDWQQKTVPTQAVLNGVYIGDSGIWAVGHDAIILGSQDGGESWEVKQFIPELERPLMDVHFRDQQNGVAIGAYGVFFRTSDGGQNWEREYHPSFLHPDDREYVESLRDQDPEFYREEMSSILPHLNRLSYSNGRLFVAGETGLVAYSDDYGKQWTRVETGYYGSFFDIQMLADGRVLAGGLRGSVYRSDISIENWQRIETNTTSTFNSIVSIDEKNTLLIGNNGTQLWMSDDGVSLRQAEDGKALVAATVFNNKIIAVSEVGVKELPFENQGN